MKKKLTVMFLSLVMMLSCFASVTTAFAAESPNINSTDEFDIENMLITAKSNYDPAGTHMYAGRHYLGDVTVNNNRQGGSRYYHGKKVRLILAWKSSDGKGDVDIETQFVGKFKRFYCKDDGNGVDENGFYYVVSTEWYDIPVDGGYYGIFYDVVTRQGLTPPGGTRSAYIHTWVDIE